MVELIWEAGRRATCTATPGGRLTAGDEASWSTDDLLAGAVATSVMRTFLELAGAMPILGYVAAAELVLPAAEDVPHVSLRLCVTVTGVATPEAVCSLCAAACARAPLARALARPVRLSCEALVLTDVDH